jgi:hypothetical protein
VCREYFKCHESGDQARLKRLGSDGTTNPKDLSQAAMLDISQLGLTTKPGLKLFLNLQNQSDQSSKNLIIFFFAKEHISKYFFM